MAPEIILRREQTPAIDIYSLGATLFYALTGKVLYGGRNIQEVLRKHVRAVVPDIRKLLPDCPSSLAALITRTIAKDPTIRPSAADMAIALRAEAITIQADDSGAVSLGGSSIVHDLTGSHVGTSPMEAQLGIIGELRKKIKGVVVRQRFLIPAAVVVLTIAVGIVLFGVNAPLSRLWSRRSTQPVRLAMYFPDAPESYGVLPPSKIRKPIGSSSETPPLFSWVGKINPESFKFVGSRRGLAR
jgi:serine/threonine protein kinase